MDFNYDSIVIYIKLKYYTLNYAKNFRYNCT